MDQQPNGSATTRRFDETRAALALRDVRVAMVEMRERQRMRAWRITADGGTVTDARNGTRLEVLCDAVEAAAFDLLNALSTYEDDAAAAAVLHDTGTRE